MQKILRFLMHNLHQSWGVVTLCLGIITGAIIGIIFRINYFNSPIWILVVVVIFIFMYLRPKFFIVGVCLIAGMILAFFRIATELEHQNHVRQFYGKNITISGTIDGDPETDEKTTKFKIKNISLNEKNIANISIYVSSSKNEDLAWGDTVILNGELKEGFGTYSGYLYRPKILKITKPDPGNLILVSRNWLAEKIRSKIGKKESDLGLSYLLGMKTELDDDLSENLRMVGLTHIVVASGAHLSILVEIAKKIFGKISRFSGILFSILFILFFMSMIGWTPSILRAGVMTILTLVSWYVGRKIQPWRLILLVAAFTLMLEPMFLINLGWLLSFASYAGIMILGPILTRFFYGEKKPKFVASVILTTIAATLMTLPIIMYYYGQISIISVLANLLILPTLPYAMGLTFLTGIFAELPGVGTSFGFLTEKLIDFHITVVDFFGSMEQFIIKIEPYEPKIFLLYLIILAPFAVGLFIKTIQKPNRKIE
ncbi:ComEC/Rec2 family competence protein [Candidatus Saccharibacteria bacterium]|nr:ComEC/Rec2 family competence protein [Candidatus Saccharibacteria bacterium]